MRAALRPAHDDRNARPHFRGDREDRRADRAWHDRGRGHCSRTPGAARGRPAARVARHPDPVRSQHDADVPREVRAGHRAWHGRHFLRRHRAGLAELRRRRRSDVYDWLRSGDEPHRAGFEGDLRRRRRALARRRTDGPGALRSGGRGSRSTRLAAEPRVVRPPRLGFPAQGALRRRPHRPATSSRRRTSGSSRSSCATRRAPSARSTKIS